MELDVLYTHIASPPVVTGFFELAQRIANKELPHGADIIVGIHERLLKGRHPLPSTSTSPKPSPPRGPLFPSLDPPGSSYELPTPVVRDLNDTTEPSTSTFLLSPHPFDLSGRSYELPTPVIRDLNDTTEPSTSTFLLSPPSLDPPGSLFGPPTPVVRDLNNTTAHESEPSHVNECNDEPGLSEEPSESSGLLFDAESPDNMMERKKKKMGTAASKKKKKR